jgi:hypothetical protein
MWPPGRPGRERFVDLVCEAWTGGLCSATTWPTAAWLVLFSLQQPLQEWGDEPAAALLEHFNIERAEATMSDAQRKTFEEGMKPFARLRQAKAAAPILR